MKLVEEITQKLSNKEKHLETIRKELTKRRTYGMVESCNCRYVCNCAEDYDDWWRYGWHM